MRIGRDDKGEEVASSTDLVRVPRLLLEPLFGDVVPLSELELALGDVQPPGLFLWKRERGMLQLVSEPCTQSAYTHPHILSAYAHVFICA